MNSIPRTLPSPMRMLRAWLFRERTVRGAADIALDVAERQVAREERVVHHVCDEASEIDRRAEEVRVIVARAMGDEHSPGVIDQQEAKQVSIALIGVTLATHEHNKTLRALT